MRNITVIIFLTISNALMASSIDTLKFQCESKGLNGYVYIQKVRCKKCIDYKFRMSNFNKFNDRYQGVQLKKDSLFFTESCEDSTEVRKYIGLLSDSILAAKEFCSMGLVSDFILEKLVLIDEFSKKKTYKYIMQPSVYISHIPFLSSITFDDKLNIVEYGFYDGFYNNKYVLVR